MSGAERAPVGIELCGLAATFRSGGGDVAAVRGIDLDIRPGELLTLLGPSGCGKTTTLRMIAGFQPPSAGSIRIGGQDVTHVPPHRRDIGIVFQSYALFPHLNVHENVAYGLRVRHVPAAQRSEAVRDALRLVGLDGLEERGIGELSGGQQQRVALARAVVIQPRVLLFDDALSNLDAKLRVQVREDIAELQRRLGITTVYVTHDQEEAMAISSRVAVMQAGRIAQLGTAEELYRRPSSAFVASFLGRANLIPGVVRAVSGTRVTLGLADGEIQAECPDPHPVGCRVIAVVRPEAVALETSGSGDGLAGHVVKRTFLGEKTEYAVTVGSQLLQITRHHTSEPDPFIPGSAVSVHLPTLIQLVPDEAGADGDGA